MDLDVFIQHIMTTISDDLLVQLFAKYSKMIPIPVTVINIRYLVKPL